MRKQFATYARRKDSLCRPQNQISPREAPPYTKPPLKPREYIKIIGPGYELYVVFGEHIDVAAQTTRMRRQLAGVQQACTKTRARLANRGFLDNADPAIVQREREKLTRLEAAAGRAGELLRSTLTYFDNMIVAFL